MREGLMHVAKCCKRHVNSCVFLRELTLGCQGLRRIRGRLLNPEQFLNFNHGLVLDLSVDTTLW
jgi:hypothetical protein